MEMNHPESPQEYLDELKNFLAFLKRLWGILAGISVFFPLSNVLLQVIPLGQYGVDDGVFNILSPSLITTVAMVAALFVVLVTYASRAQLRQPKRRRAVLRSSWLSLGVGFLSLVAYLVLHQIYREYAWEPWGWGSDDPRKLIAEVPLLITYAIFFSSLTRAFMMLGILEFFGSKSARQR